MKILLLINWKITYCDTIPENLQPSDYSCKEEAFWFFKYFDNVPDVDVIDISSPTWIEKIEKKIRFHFYQTLRILNRINKYDLIFVHGSNSAMLLCALKRMFKIKTPPILDVDISSFHQAYTKGIMHRLAQFSSKEFDYMVYHTSSQKQYYAVNFPWLSEKSKFIPLAVDYKYWTKKEYPQIKERDSYIICVGYRKRDWDTLLKAYNIAGIKEKLYLIGNPNIECDNKNVVVMPFMKIDELMTYIKNCRYSVIPLDDFNYSFGQLTLLQQMALGTPILAADVPAIRDYAGVSSGVQLYKAYDIEDLAFNLTDMSQKSQDKINKMRNSNICVIKNELSEESMAKRFEEICNTLVKTKKV